MKIEVWKRPEGYEVHHSMKSPLDDWPTICETDEQLEATVTHLIRYYIKERRAMPKVPKLIPEEELGPIRKAKYEDG